MTHETAPQSPETGKSLSDAEVDALMEEMMAHDAFLRQTHVEVEDAGATGAMDVPVKHIDVPTTSKEAAILSLGSADPRLNEQAIFGTESDHE